MASTWSISRSHLCHWDYWLSVFNTAECQIDEWSWTGLLFPLASFTTTYHTTHFTQGPWGLYRKQLGTSKIIYLVPALKTKSTQRSQISWRFWISWRISGILGFLEKYSSLAITAFPMRMENFSFLCNNQKEKWCQSNYAQSCTLRKKSWNEVCFVHTLRFLCFVHRIEVGNVQSDIRKASGFVITMEPFGFVLTKEVNVFLLRVCQASNILMSRIYYSLSRVCKMVLVLVNMARLE